MKQAPKLANALVEQMLIAADSYWLMLIETEKTVEIFQLLFKQFQN